VGANVAVSVTITTRWMHGNGAFGCVRVACVDCGVSYVFFLGGNSTLIHRRILITDARRRIDELVWSELCSSSMSLTPC